MIQKLWYINWYWQTDMKTNNLESVLKDINWGRKWKGSPMLSVASLSQVEANIVSEHIYISLEPENLHCDGEISRSQAMTKYRMLNGALKELSKLGFAVSKPDYF